MDVSSDEFLIEAAKTYIWTISVRLAGFSGVRINLGRRHSKPPVISAYTNGLDDEWAGCNAVERRVFLPRLIAVWRPTLFCETFK